MWVHPSKVSVAVIGCGPGGMSFLHAVATHQKKYEEEGNQEGLARLPIVTVFERNSQPGGVWRSNQSNQAQDDIGIANTCASTPITAPTNHNDSNEQIEKEEHEEEDRFLCKQSMSSTDHTDTDEIVSDDDEESVSSSDLMSDSDYIVEGRTSSTTQMYEALWTNGPSQGIEFPDYTFNDHFECPVPIYMSRRAVLDYMITRVTRNNPDVFDSVHFNTTVEKVSFNEEMKKFEIVISQCNSTTSDETSRTQYFDKCIWAAGNNGCAKIPKSIRSILRKGGFTGIDLHSSQAAESFGDLKGTHIVMIGDGLSAEDLSLQAIKLGINKIYVIARSGDGACSYTSNWPGNKVEVIENRAISEVILEGTALRLVKTKYGIGTGKIEETDCNDFYDIKNIAAVIYCTGYEANDKMIGEDLWGSEEYDDGYINDLPQDWTMQSNQLIDDIGSVQPAAYLETYTEYISICNGYFHGIFMDNPNLMYLSQSAADNPLLEIDVRSWYFLHILLGLIDIPSKDEMIQENRHTVHQAMHIPSIRYYMDKEYNAAFGELAKNGKFSWLNDDLDCRSRQLTEDASRFALCVFAEEMKVANYPLQLGSIHRLNEKGEQILKMESVADLERCAIEKSDWKTFRDIDPVGFKSIHTGTQAVPLMKKWIDIDD